MRIVSDVSTKTNYVRNKQLYQLNCTSLFICINRISADLFELSLEKHMANLKKSVKWGAVLNENVPDGNYSKT